MIYRTVDNKFIQWNLFSIKRMSPKYFPTKGHWSKTFRKKFRREISFSGLEKGSGPSELVVNKLLRSFQIFMAQEKKKFNESFLTRNVAKKLLGWFIEIFFSMMNPISRKRGKSHKELVKVRREMNSLIHIALRHFFWLKNFSSCIHKVFSFFLDVPRPREERLKERKLRSNPTECKIYAEIISIQKHKAIKFYRFNPGNE